MADQAYREIQVTDTFAVSPGYLNGTSQALKGGFNGTAAPASPTAYQFWYDTAAGLKKQRNAANDAWIVVGVLGATDDGHLALSGGTMTGDISLGTTRRITNMAAPSAANDAVRKADLDLKAPIASPAFTTDAQLNVDPPQNNSLTRKVWTEGRYLKLSGGTMTGAIVLSGNATADLQAVPRQQVRDFVSFSLSGHRHDGTDARKVKGSSLDSENQASGYVPLASGAGATSWGQIGSGSIAPSVVQQAHLSTNLIEVSVAIGSTPSEVEVAVGSLFGYSHLPELKHSQATGKTIFQGVSNVGTTYGINMVQLRGEVISGTLFARFRQVLA
jgi:hypothetical protein